MERAQFDSKKWGELVQKAFSETGIELPKNFSFDKKEDIIALRNKIYEESIQKSFSETGIRQMRMKSSNDNSIVFENDMGTKIKLCFANEEGKTEKV